MAFQLGCDQTHGLVAHRSDRHQQRDVHGVFDEQLRGGRRGLLIQSSGRGDRTHEGEMTPIERADAPAFGQLARAIDREGEVGILLNAGMVE